MCIQCEESIEQPQWLTMLMPITENTFKSKRGVCLIQVFGHLQRTLIWHFLLSRYIYVIWALSFHYLLSKTMKAKTSVRGDRIDLIFDISMAENCTRWVLEPNTIRHSAWQVDSLKWCLNSGTSQAMWILPNLSHFSCISKNEKVELTSASEKGRAGFLPTSDLPLPASSTTFCPQL